MSNEVKTKEKIDMDPKYIVKLTVTLLGTCLIVALLLGLVNGVTAGPIAEINQQKTEAAMLAVVSDPDNTTFSDALELSGDMTAAATAAGGTLNEMYEVQVNGEAAGYAVKVTASGSQGSIEMMVGVDVEGAVTGVRGEKDTYPAEAVVLATGGVSYPATGSTGDGYRMAAQLGHEIVPPHGSLVPLVSEDEACRQMQGLALKNVELTVLNRKGKAIFREFGEMLFTHFGVSGPLVLSASAHLRNWEKETYRLSIDLKPALDEQKLESRILRDLGEAPNRSVERIFSGLVPHSMVPVILNRLGMDPQQQANAVTREQRRALVQLLKHFTMPVTGPRPVAEAIITSGGVKVGQVQPATMASKLVQGLYFAGEILDVDAYTGGFNLQIAWATGRLAGASAAQEG